VGGRAQWKSEPKRASAAGGLPRDPPKAHAARAVHWSSPERAPTARLATPPRTARRGPSPTAGGRRRTAGACGTHVQRSAAPAGPWQNRLFHYNAPGAQSAVRQGGERPHGTAIHLHDEGPAQGHAAGQGDPQGDLALVLSRRPRSACSAATEREEHAPAHHGRGGQGLRGEAFAATARASAAFPRSRSSTPRRPSSRSSRGGGSPARDPPEVRGPLRELVGRERGRARPPAGPDRRPEPLGAGPPRRDGDGRSAPPPGRRRT
jgi:hypothetical protein